MKLSRAQLRERYKQWCSENGPTLTWDEFKEQCRTLGLSTEHNDERPDGSSVKDRFG